MRRLSDRNTLQTNSTDKQEKAEAWQQQLRLLNINPASAEREQGEYQSKHDAILKEIYDRTFWLNTQHAFQKLGIHFENHWGSYSWLLIGMGAIAGAIVFGLTISNPITAASVGLCFSGLAISSFMLAYDSADGIGCFESFFRRTLGKFSPAICLGLISAIVTIAAPGAVGIACFFLAVVATEALIYSFASMEMEQDWGEIYRLKYNMSCAERSTQRTRTASAGSLRIGGATPGPTT